MKVDGITMSIIGDTGGVKLDGEFQVSSETRTRYGTQATSLKIQNQENSTVQSVEVEIDTKTLIDVLLSGGLTADDLRLYADLADGAITKEAPYVPGAITNEFE